MTSTNRIWMTRQDYTRLHNELAVLRSRRTIDVPDDFMDHNANLVTTGSAQRGRIREIQDVLTNAVVDDERADDPIAEAGMVLTIRYDATGETETFHLGRRGAPKGSEMKVYSMASPLGRSIAGARPGDHRIYAIPHERGVLVTLLKAVPYKAHGARRHRSHSGRAAETSAAAL
jgi:transcription elongation factor GreA